MKKVTPDIITTTSLNHATDSATYDSARIEVTLNNLRKIDLTETYMLALEGNPSKDLPYHGNQHLMAVANLCVPGAIIHGGKLEDIQALFLAGLFHDCDYTVGATETENIANAVSFARRTVDRLNPKLTDNVINFIRATEFPHHSPASKMEEVIQDADLLMISQPDAEQFLIGLSLETGDSLTRDFPGRKVLHTDWAKNIYDGAMLLKESEHRIIDPVEAVSVGGTSHVQALSSRGFLVDQNLLLDLEALWAAGFETKYSCGGDRGFKENPEFEDGYIAFLNITTKQLKVLKRAAKKTRISPPTVFHSLEGFTAEVLRFRGDQASKLVSEILKAANSLKL